MHLIDLNCRLKLIFVLLGDFNWTAGNDDQVLWARNCDFGGYDINKEQSSSEECSQLCLSNLNCTHFTWGVGSYCYMKSAINPKASPFNGAICGLVRRRKTPSAFDWQEGNDGLVKWATNCDFGGHDVQKEPSSSKEECRALCLANENCTHFTWGVGSFCYMKSAVNPKVSPFNGAVCGWVKGREPLQFNWQKSNGGQVKWARNCDFTGHEISKEPSASDECAGLCLANENCTHFNWGGSYCNIKSAINPKLSSTRNETICGSVDYRKLKNFQWQDGDDGQVKWANNCDFSGFDIKKEIVNSSEECSALCIANENCTHFTWGTGSYCYMKSAVKNEAAASHGAVCGRIVKRKSIAVHREDIDIFHWTPGTDFFAYYVGKKKTSFEYCGEICLANPQCTQFSWSSDYCYLRSAVI